MALAPERNRARAAVRAQMLGDRDDVVLLVPPERDELACASRRERGRVVR